MALASRSFTRWFWLSATAMQCPSPESATASAPSPSLMVPRSTSLAAAEGRWRANAPAAATASRGSQGDRHLRRAISLPLQAEIELHGGLRQGAAGQQRYRADQLAVFHERVLAEIPLRIAFE